MDLISVDLDKCLQDGLCVADCPLGILRLDKDKHPEPIPGADELCIDCGHCVAVCPSQALSQRAMATKQCPSLNKDLTLSVEQARQFLKSRRSIRQYKKELVTQDLLEKLIDLASYAPSGHNVQPVRWLVISGLNEVKQIASLVIDWMRQVMKDEPQIAKMFHFDRTIEAWEAGTDRVLRAAPHLIITHAPQDERTAPIGCATALAYLELAAPALGLGTCWAGYFNRAAQVYEPLKKHLDLPKSNMVFGAAMTGYPRAKYQRLPLRQKPQITWK